MQYNEVNLDFDEAEDREKVSELDILYGEIKNCDQCDCKATWKLSIKQHIKSIHVCVENIVSSAMLLCREQ